MRLRSLGFAGYRSFAARSPANPNRELELLQLAPLTILLGKNNSGKSNAARLLHHVLLALGQGSGDPFPMAGGGQIYGETFRDVQHGGVFFSPLDLKVQLNAEDGARAEIAAQLIRPGDSVDDLLPIVRSRSFNGQTRPGEEERPVHGLLTGVPDGESWRDGARELLGASCHLGPLRESVRSTYSVNPSTLAQRLPANTEAVAQLLLTDVELRNAVGDWMAEHLEGWRVDVRQNLDNFYLVGRRAGRDVNLAASGQGIQQVLPVAVLCCWRKLGRGAAPFLDVIEQPELHMHDAAHAPLGDLLLSAVRSGRGNVVIETHSESLVLRIRRRVAEGTLAPDKVAIVYVEDSGDGSHLKPILLSANGEVDWWPEGVFSEAFVEVKAIARAQREHAGT